jgi:hypothetical protein
MKIPEENQLLNDVLGGDELDRFRDATLTRSLDAMRQRRHRRRQFQGAAVMALLLFLGIRWHFQQKLPSPSEIVVAPAPAAEASQVKYITEKELFALFPNRPIALIGEPGHQQFLLLDELETRAKH